MRITKFQLVSSIEIGNPEITEVVEELKYSQNFDKVNSFNTIERIPSTMKLEFDWSDTYLHYCIGEWFMFALIFTAFNDLAESSRPILIVVFLIATFMLGIPWLRRSSAIKMVMLKQEFAVSSYRFRWSNIEKIYKIRTSTRKPNYGIRLVLKDKTEVNIDLALRKPSNGDEYFMFHYIYIFWKRGTRID